MNVINANKNDPILETTIGYIIMFLEKKNKRVSRSYKYANVFSRWLEKCKQIRTRKTNDIKEETSNDLSHSKRIAAN